MGSFLEKLSSRWKVVFALAMLGVAGTLAVPLGNFAWKDARERIGAFDPKALENSAGTGIALGTVGGFRTVIADGMWLRAFHFWGERNPAACLKYCKLAITLAPEQYFFLENTANYVAFDFPIWEIRRRGGFMHVPKAVQKEIQKKALNDALALLDEAALSDPENPKIFVLAAQITAIKTDVIYGRPDFARAAEYYRRACELPGAPWFAFVTYAKFISDYVPEKRIEAKAFLEDCLKNAKTPSKQRFFEELLSDFSSR